MSAHPQDLEVNVGKGVDLCPLCERPNLHPTDHHLVPRCRGGKDTLTVCRDCHRAIHECFPNKLLEKEYSTVEALLGDSKLRQMVAFISRQDPGGKVRFKRSKRKWGRNG
jgi:hypothetical protein